MKMNFYNFNIFNFVTTVQKTQQKKDITHTKLFNNLVGFYLILHFFPLNDQFMNLPCVFSGIFLKLLDPPKIQQLWADI